MTCIRRRCCIAGGLLLMFALAMTPGLRRRIVRAAQEGWQAAQVFASVSPGEVETVLPAMEIHMLQLGVFDNAESAARERQRFMSAGIPCMLWQGERMRILCGAAYGKEGLDASLAGENAYCVFSERLLQTDLKFGGDAQDAQRAAEFFGLPDRLLRELIAGEKALGEIILDASAQAEQALDRHPENSTHTELAQGLLDWCAMITGAQKEFDETKARGYAASTMALLCRELRRALLGVD